MITIKEIASRLGLSTTTVSNVIHGKTKEVSAETIARVQKFLEEVEYVPNINARNLAQGQSKIIGVVLKTLDFRLWYSDNILSDPFVAEMIGGIERAVREAGYYMMLYISDDIAEIIQHISIWNVDGLILFSMMDDDGNRVAAKYHKPIVCIDTYSSAASTGRGSGDTGGPLRKPVSNTATEISFCLSLPKRALIGILRSCAGKHAIIRRCSAVRIFTP